MYAYSSRGPRSVSLGMSLGISSAIVLALVYVSPGIIETVEHKRTVLIDIQPPTIPPEVPPEQKTEPETRNDPMIVAPIPEVITPVRETTLTTAGTEPAGPPPIFEGGAGAGAGPAVIEPPAPPLPLIGASLDSRYARYLQPDYPGQELRLGREGVVTVRIRIGIDGRVTQVEKVSATSDAFFEVTKRQALSKWRFRPATRGSVPEESWKQMTVRFTLNEG